MHNVVMFPNIVHCDYVPGGAKWCHDDPNIPPPKFLEGFFFLVDAFFSFVDDWLVDVLEYIIVSTF